MHHLHSEGWPDVLQRRLMIRGFRHLLAVSLALVVDRPLLAQEEILVVPPSRVLDPQPTTPVPQKARGLGLGFPGQPQERAKNPLGSFRVRLIDSLKSVDEIPRTGQKQIILAKVGQVIHLRVFDDDGSMVVDADTDLLPEKPFSLKLGEPGNRLLKDKLKGFWPPHELNESERTKVIAAVESIFDIWEVRLWKNGTDPYKKVYEIMSKTPADSEPVDNEVRGLLRKRRDSKMRYLFTKGGFYEESRLNFEGLTADVISALRTQLDWLEDPADQVMIYELLLEFAGDLERTKAAEIEVGRATVADLEQARTQRINCEIDLLRAKRKLPKK